MVTDKKRYEADPEYRANVLANNSTYRKRDPEKRKAQDSSYYKRNKSRVRENQLKRFYGMTNEDYEDMFAAQDGLCYLCRQPPKEGKKLCIDHCHITKKVRSLLCHRCNTLIGYLEKSYDLWDKAFAYLEKFGA